MTDWIDSQLFGSLRHKAMRTRLHEVPGRTIVWWLWAFVLNVLLISTIVWRIYEKHHAGNSVDYRLFGALALAVIGIVLFGLFILSTQKSPK